MRFLVITLTMALTNMALADPYSTTPSELLEERASDIVDGFTNRNLDVLINASFKQTYDNSRFGYLRELRQLSSALLRVDPRQLAISPHRHNNFYRLLFAKAHTLMTTLPDPLASAESRQAWNALALQFVRDIATTFQYAPVVSKLNMEYRDRFTITLRHDVAQSPLPSNELAIVVNIANLSGQSQDAHALIVLTHAAYFHEYLKTLIDLALRLAAVGDYVADPALMALRQIIINVRMIQRANYFGLPQSGNSNFTIDKIRDQAIDSYEQFAAASNERDLELVDDAVLLAIDAPEFRLPFADEKPCAIVVDDFDFIKQASRVLEKLLPR